MLIHRPTYEEFQEYIVTMRYHLLLAVLVFTASMVTGYGCAALSPGLSAELMNKLSSQFGALVELPPLLLMLRIFAQNSVLCFAVILLGILFGIIPIVFLIYNGFILGAVIYVVSQKHGIVLVLLNILPHGVIEIPMVLLSVAIGIRLGHETIKKLLGEGAIKKTLIDGLRIYAFWILPLLFVAAAIEVALVI